MEGSCMELALEGEKLCNKGDYEKALRFFEAALQVGTKDLETLSTIHSYLGNAYYHLEDHKQSLEYHMNGLNLTRAAAFKLGEANAYGYLSNTLKALGRYEEAIVCCQQQLRVAREIGNNAVEATALYNLGSIYYVQGWQMGQSYNLDPGELPSACRERLQKAVEYYEANLKLIKATGNRASEGRTYGSLGNTHYCLGNFSQAIHCHEMRLSSAKEFGDRVAECRAYNNLGNSRLFLGEFRAAADMYSKALHISIILGNRECEAQACWSLGITYFLLREYESAIEFFSRHMAIANELRDRYGEGRACWRLGEVYKTIGNLEAALAYGKQHLEISKEVGDEIEQELASVALAQLQEMIDLANMESLHRSSSSFCSDGTDQSKSRRPSMENLSLLALTPDKKEKRADKQSTKMPGKIQGRKSGRPSNAQPPKSQNSYDDPEDNLLFDLVSRSQSRRIDDQRCSFSAVNSKQPRVKPSYVGSKNHESNKENSEPQTKNEEFFDLVAGIQGSRINDQRADLTPIPKSNSSQPLGGAIASEFTEVDEEETFFDMLARCQSMRIEDQCGVLPQRRPAPTIPNEDFITLIERLQSSRLDEQRSTVPTVPATPVRSQSKFNKGKISK